MLFIFIDEEIGYDNRVLVYDGDKDSLKKEYLSQELDTGTLSRNNINADLLEKEDLFKEGRRQVFSVRGGNLDRLAEIADAIIIEDGLDNDVMILDGVRYHFPIFGENIFFINSDGPFVFENGQIKPLFKEAKAEKPLASEKVLSWISMADREASEGVMPEVISERGCMIVAFWLMSEKKETSEWDQWRTLAGICGLGLSRRQRAIILKKVDADPDDVSVKVSFEKWLSALEEAARKGGPEISWEEAERRYLQIIFRK